MQITLICWMWGLLSARALWRCGVGSIFQWCQYLFLICLQGSRCDLGCNLGRCLAAFKTVLGDIWGTLNFWGTIWIMVSRRELQGLLPLFGAHQWSCDAQIFVEPVPLFTSLGLTGKLQSDLKTSRGWRQGWESPTGTGSIN